MSGKGKGVGEGSNERGEYIQTLEKENQLLSKKKSNCIFMHFKSGPSTNWDITVAFE